MKVRETPEYKQSESLWQTCAAAAGYSFPSRADLISTLRQRDRPITDQMTSVIGTRPLQGLTTMDYLATNLSGYRQAWNEEIAGATATFACSERADSVYTTLYLRLREQS